MKSPLSRDRLIILAGVDALVVLAITLIGFASHQETLTIGRWLAIFIPLLLAWASTAPWFGLFSEKATLPGQFWRACWAAVLAAPLAVFIRGLWLQTSVNPIFTAVMIATTAFGLGLWRLFWAFLVSRKN